MNRHFTFGAASPLRAGPITALQRFGILGTMGALLAAVLLTGCIGVEAGAETRTLINKAVGDITNQSADWRQVLERTINDLPKDVQSTVRNELNSLLQRGIAAAGAEGRCDIDFIGDRVLQGLIRIRAGLLGQESPVREPKLCSADPTLIPMAEFEADPSRFPSINLYGYDFDVQPDMQVLLTENGVVTDVTRDRNGVKHLNLQGHYRMVLNLGPNGVRLTRQSQKISVVWDGKPLAEIPVNQSRPRCVVRSHPIDGIGTSVVRARLLAGDPEFGTNQPHVDAGVRLMNQGTHVDAEVWIDAVEARNGDTHGSGRSVFTIYSPPDGWKVHRIVTPDSDSIGYYHDTDWEMDPFVRAGAGPVALFRVWGDTHGWDVEPDREDGTRVEADFRRVTIEEIQTKDCD